MKQAAHAWIYLAAGLALLTSPALSAAQQKADEPLLQQARSAVAKRLGRAPADVSFAGLQLIHDKLGAVVCGSANGDRFLADAGKEIGPPQLESALGASVFNFLWNARCRGMSAAAATEILKREMKR